MSAPDPRGVLHAVAGSVDRNGKPPRVAVYCRVSSDEQAQAGTIENQLDFARRYCDRHGRLVHDFYTDERVSGALAVDERPNGRRLLATPGRAGSAPCWSTASRILRNTAYVGRYGEQVRKPFGLRSHHPSPS